MSETLTEIRTDCRTCQARDVDQSHVQRCAVRTKARADAIAHGRGDVGIHATKTSDLWAHAFSRTCDPIVALDLTKTVIDLGWRPVVGRYDTWETAPAPAGGGSE
jgi:hypothetical protein